MTPSLQNVVGRPISILQLSEYFMAAKENRRPAFVPSKIRIHNEVRGDMIFSATRVGPGIHECSCNQWGAICVKAENGKMLGIKWDECEIVELTANPSHHDGAAPAPSVDGVVQSPNSGDE